MHRLLVTALLCCVGLFAAPVRALAATDCVVALDIGHTPQTPGATSAFGVPEYEYNLAMTEVLAVELQARGIESRIINPSGAEIGLTERTRRAQAMGADLFVSIHHDSAQEQLLTPWRVNGRQLLYTDDISGFSLFVSERNKSFEQSLRLAAAIGRALTADGFSPTLHHAEPIPGEGRPLLNAKLGIYRFDGLAVLRTATVPAVLVECGVIVNRADAKRLLEPRRRAQQAEAIAAGVAAYCNAGASISNRSREHSMAMSHLGVGNANRWPRAHSPFSGPSQHDGGTHP